MRKADIERILLDPEALKQLTESANVIKQSGGISAEPSNPAAKVSSAGQTPFSTRATPEEIRANDLTAVRRRGLFANIGRFYPDLVNQDAPKALSILTEQYQKYPSQDSQLLIQDAINRITHVGEVDADSRKIVSQAIEVLTSVKLPNQDSDRHKDSIFSNLYEHSDFRGRSMFAYLGPDSIYQSVQKSYLQQIDLHDKISSLTLDASAGEFRGDVILFQDDRFFGRFTGVRTTLNNPTQQVSASYVGDYINDRTSSLMLVRRYDDEDSRALGDPISKALIGNIIGGTKGIRELRGDPVFTWDMWPTGGDSHPNDPEKRFIQIKIPVVIDVPHWFDYDAEIRLWFYLYISAGYLRGYLAYYGAWVEGGIKSQEILDKLMAAIPDNFGEIDTTLNTLLSSINGSSRIPMLGPFTAVYLLPGDQSLFSGQAMEGNVADNVTIVLVRRHFANELTTSTVMLL
jgi:hypothetical protein